MTNLTNHIPDLVMNRFYMHLQLSAKHRCKLTMVTREQFWCVLKRLFTFRSFLTFLFVNRSIMNLQPIRVYCFIFTKATFMFCFTFMNGSKMPSKRCQVAKLLFANLALLVVYVVMSLFVFYIRFWIDPKLNTGVSTYLTYLKWIFFSKKKSRLLQLGEEYERRFVNESTFIGTYLVLDFTVVGLYVIIKLLHHCSLESA